jgi:hypothetical protein
MARLVVELARRWDIDPSGVTQVVHDNVARLYVATVRALNP